MTRDAMRTGARLQRTPVPGAMQRAALRGVMLRRTGTVPNAGVRNGPGSAAHRSASAARSAASGVRRSFTGMQIPVPIPDQQTLRQQENGERPMKLGAAIAEIMKREGIEILCGYPVNHLIEFAANAEIRPIMVRQERIGLHMADAISRVTSGRSIGAFCMQHGPGAENAMGGVAQCFGESVPVLVLPMGYARRISNIEPNFNSSQAMKAFAKSSEPINLATEVGNIFRRAFTKLKNGRGGPVIVEIS